ncbi:MAG: MarR family transcriptional regulator [Albidovulum sp.]
MTFSLPTFLPYLLNQAAEAVSQEFQHTYRERYGMLRTEWRVLFHLGVYGDMTAKQICNLSSTHKTKISRAVAALEAKRFATRRTDQNDRRLEHLALTRLGKRVFDDLHETARQYEADISAELSVEELDQLRLVLQKLARSSK